MKSHSINTSRRLLALAALVACLAAPVAPVALAADKKGEKEYKRGLQHEQAQQWEQAAQEFALAVAAKPSNIEYQLHYRRAVFNASQVFMQKGRALAEREDFVGAYNAFRQSYGYDPVNQLALAEMQRMMRLQRERDERGKANPAAPNSATETARRVPVSYVGGEAQQPQRAQDTLPATPERQRTIIWNNDLEGLIRKLAEELNLNVVFDKDFRKQDINITLRDVTTAQALDIIFQTRGLFFQRLNRRTILIADQQKRQQFQPLELRTFYIKNMDLSKVQGQLQQMFPPQQGRPAMMVVPNDRTNSITVRDTPENMRVIEQVIRSLDKDRAAMVFDVQIYEVSRTDLLQLGGQLGNSGNFGGTTPLLVPFSENNAQRLLGTGTSAVAATTALGAGLIIPSLQLSALQDKKNTRLLDSTQLHAFDGENVEQRIGQRVPVQTASVFSTFGGNGQNNPNVPNAFGGGFPVVQYEPTGLTINFKKPQVFPSSDGDFDVQVEMALESKDIAGAQTATPTFSERSLKGIARIRNNQTLMLASVARNQQARGRQGLPLLGLIPVLGRFISTPIRDDRNSDIVIAITPRVLRAPSITPEDEISRPIGSQMQPLSDSLAAVVREVEREDQLAREAAAKRETQLAAAAQVPAPVSNTAAPAANAPAVASSAVASNNAPSFIPAPRALLPQAAAAAAPNAGEPIVRPVVISATPGATAASIAANIPAPPPLVAAPAPAAIAANLLIAPRESQMRVGERKQFMLALTTEAQVRMAIATLKFDPKQIAVRNVALGNVAAGQENQPLLSYSANGAGVLLASVAAPAGKQPMNPAGVLLVIEIEALAPGESRLEFAGDGVHLAAADDRTFAPRAEGARIVVVNK